MNVTQALNHLMTKGAKILTSARLTLINVVKMVLVNVSTQLVVIHASVIPAMNFAYFVMTKNKTSYCVEIHAATDKNAIRVKINVIKIHGAAIL